MARTTRLLGLMIAATLPAAAAQADDRPATTPISGTRLDVSADGQVTRAPDIATITAGVVTQSGNAQAAMAANAKRMAAAVAALHQAGVAERDIRTSALNLQPQYRYTDGQPPAITGYQASNQLGVTFRDIGRAGAILDALVGQGVNQISGPDFALEHPDAALDEARMQAIAKARAQADVYAKALGMHVTRVVTVSESGGYQPPAAPRAFMMARAEKATTDLQPGEERIGVAVQVTFELQ